MVDGGDVWARVDHVDERAIVKHFVPRFACVQRGRDRVHVVWRAPLGLFAFFLERHPPTHTPATYQCLAAQNARGPTGHLFPCDGQRACLDRRPPVFTNRVARNLFFFFCLCIRLTASVHPRALVARSYLAQLLQSSVHGRELLSPHVHLVAPFSRKCRLFLFFRDKNKKTLNLHRGDLRVVIAVDDNFGSGRGSDSRGECAASVEFDGGGVEEADTIEIARVEPGRKDVVLEHPVDLGDGEAHDAGVILGIGFVLSDDGLPHLVRDVDLEHCANADVQRHELVDRLAQLGGCPQGCIKDCVTGVL